MTRTSRVGRLAVGLAVLTVALGTGPAVAGPAVAGPAPGGTAAPPWADVLVVLRSQADLAGAVSAAHPRTRAARLAAVERALRDTAAAGQRGILARLQTGVTQDRVAQVTPLWIQNEVAVRATPDMIAELAARADVREIRPELSIAAPAPTGPKAPAKATAKAKATAATAAPEPNLTQVNAPALWNLGVRGQGVVVAGLDTGVDVTHPDLAGRWRGGANSWFDPNGEHPSTPVDVSGHGTQTMSVIVGGDAGGSSIGMAPAATWIAAKIFNDRGSATTTGVHRSFQWLLDPDGNPATPDAPQVVSDSWTMSTAACSLEFQPDLAGLRAAGIVPVFAAGNSGPQPGTVLSPANLPEALAVGGVDGSDRLDPSSSIGPSACGGPVSPVLVAPSVNVRAADLYGGYITQTGTSMAAPHVAGALALLLSAAPGTTPDGLQTALTGGAADLGAAGPDSSYGYGRLDALAAYQRLTSIPDFGLTVAPSSVGVTPGGTASYTVSLSSIAGFSGAVALSVSGPPGSVGTATLTPASVSSPGTAAISVTTAPTAAPGSYPVTVTGTNGTTSHAATAMLVVQPPPDFTLTVTPGSRTVAAGATAQYTVGVGPVNGFTGAVTLAVSGLPASVGAAVLTPPSITGAGTSVLSIGTSAGAPPGTYPLTVTGSGTGSGAGITHSVGLSLTVTPAQGFTLAATPAVATARRGGSTSYSVGVTPVGGFTGAVTLSRSGLPSGTTTSWSANPVTVPGTSVLTVRIGGATPRGTFTVRITGTSGALTQSVSVTLTVT
jgi:subtilisin family serine protease